MASLFSSGRWPAQAKKLLRAATYVALVALVFLVALTRSVWGSVRDDAFEVGSSLASLGEVLGPSYTVRLNGESVHVSSATTDLGVGRVLDRFERECREHTGGLAEELQRLQETLSSRLPPILEGPAGFGIVRRDDEQRGVVGCLARAGSGGLPAIGEALRAFERTGDLSSFGHLRYVAAQRQPDGKTHVVSAWSDGPLHVGAMFPAEADAPGIDPGPAARPPRARRLLSASVEGAPFGIQVYASKDEPDAVLAHYDREMAPAGWDAVPGVAKHFRDARAYRRAGVDLMMFAQRDGDLHTIVSLVAMSPR
jgi:hypothetical protein